MKKILSLFLFLVFLVPQVSFAHPGRTDSSGCHTCYTKCSDWGLKNEQYHCHDKKEAKKEAKRTAK